MLRPLVVFACLALGVGVAWTAPVPAPAAAAQTPACARTTAPAAPAAPAPGEPCWTDVDPYPFGADGDPVDPTTIACRPAAAPGRNYAGDQASCYLKVDSLAFRAWNRGLAATSPVVGDLSSTTAFGVWVFNGNRWFPDPTFPGQGVCKGNTVIWAGKRDYWLIGSRLGNWPSLCRFDGVNFEWEPFDVPPETLAQVPLAAGKRRSGAITAGACFTWDDCWFMGSFGVVAHWDGSALSDATPDVAANPWLRTDFTSAVVRTGSDGGQFGFAVGSTGGPSNGQQLPGRADGSAPPQLFGSSAGPFTPLGYAPPTVAQVADTFRTDLVSVDFDADGHGWVAGDPVGYRPGGSVGNPSADERRVNSGEPSPLARVSRTGEAVACPALPPGIFTYSNTPNGSNAYLWSSISTVPGAGDALAGGQMRPVSGGATLNDDRSREPVLVKANCDAPPTVTRFRVPDPTAVDQANAAPAPADRLGAVSSVAANAVNDAWAATTPGRLLPTFDPTGQFSNVTQRPRLYRLTDTRAPLAQAGDDEEPRPLVFEADPPILVEAPPDPEPAPLPDTTTTAQGPTTTKRIKLKPAVYAVRASRSVRRGKVTVYISFKVRRPVTIGVQALRRSTVVSSSGLRRFKGKSGRLALKLDRHHWPTRIRFVSPSSKKSASDLPAVSALKGPPR